MLGEDNGAVCNRCQANLPDNARRCMRCGAQIAVTPTHDPGHEAQLERERLSRKYNLSEMQKEILSAAMTGGERIFVVGNENGNEGEVKSGEKRFYGNEAVVAVATLAGRRLIWPRGDDCFHVTADGTQLAKTLGLDQA